MLVADLDPMLIYPWNRIPNPDPGSQIQPMSLVKKVWLILKILFQLTQIFFSICSKNTKNIFVKTATNKVSQLIVVGSGIRESEWE
jgi:hypothetical protein